MSNPKLLNCVVVAAALLLSHAWGAERSCAQASSPFSAQQTSGAYTLRLTGARWARQSEFQPWRQFTTPQEKAQRVLFVAGDVTAVAPTAASAASLGDATEAVAVGPQGQRLVGSHTDAQAPEQGWTFENPDTHWEPVRLEFTLKEPSAPAGSDGNISERDDLDGVPVFTDVGVSHGVNMTLTTGLGARLVFSSVRYEKGPPILGNLRDVFLDFTLVPPPSAPDMTVDVTPQVVKPAIVDELGDNLSNGNSLCSPHDQSPHYQLRLTMVTPPAAAKTLDLHLYVHQKAPNLRKAALFHAFAPILLPRTSIGAAPREAAPTPVASVIGSGLRVTAESLTAGYSGNYYARVWVRDETQPDETVSQAWAKSWRISKATLRGPDGTEHDISGYASLADTQVAHFGDSLFWKLNGTPAMGDETGYDLDFQAGVFQPIPPNLTLALQLEQVVRSYHALDFDGLPIPGPGEVVDVNVASAYGSEGKYVVTKIGSFDAAHPLSSYNGAHGRNGQEFGPALYAVLTFVPKMPGGALPPSTFGSGEDELSVVDDQGDHLTREDAIPTFGYSELLDKHFPGWRTLQPRPSPRYSVLLTMTPPSPGAKTFSIHRRLTTAVLTGKTAKVVLPVLALPPPLTTP